ncbi:MAG: BadF/BadG/BcrA/BcrD ATPase family protein [Terriglobia bacterium]
MSFFLGIDAGGSKTECVLADASGAVLAHGTGGPANLRRTPLATLQNSLETAVADALRNAGLRRANFEAVCAGFAGAGQVEARQTARQILLQLTSPRYLFIVGDMEVALEAAVGAGRGVVVLAGTGSIAYGRNDLGQQARAGGQGPKGSDEGSAFDIGRRALEAVLGVHENHEGMVPLETALREHLKLPARRALAGLLADPEASVRLAALLPVVVEVARRGDLVAQNILFTAGDALAQLTRRVLHALHLEATPTRIATCGGVFTASQEVSQRVQHRLRTWAPQAQVEPLTTAPAEGAVRLAQRLWLQPGVGRQVGS